MAEKKKTDINLPFLRIKEDEEGSHVRVGPINVEGEEVDVGPLHISEGNVSIKRTTNKRLEGIAWAAFFILIGCVWLVENVLDVGFPGLIAIGIGVIWLLLNYARSQLGIKTSSFTIILGMIAIVYGAAELLVGEVDLLPVIVIIIGVYIIYSVVKKSS
jgi:hypothetical protein